MVSNLLNLQCPHCGEKRDEVDGLVRHLGSTHKMVEGFLPDELIISKSKNMKSHTSTEEGRKELVPDPLEMGSVSETESLSSSSSSSSDSYGTMLVTMTESGVLMGVLSTFQSSPEARDGLQNASHR